MTTARRLDRELTARWGDRAAARVYRRVNIRPVMDTEYLGLVLGWDFETEPVDD